jgi:uncharacterized OsmC-like protein
MGMEDIAAALERVKAVLRRRPDVGLHDDAPATARWEHGTRVVSSHANGTRIQSDMPGELGGTGDQVTPGWMFRAGLASCTATCIAMNAAEQGIELTALEVKAGSRSDARGLLRIADTAGAAVSAAPLSVEMHVRIAANGVAPERLRALVEESQRCSPIANAVEKAVPVALRIEVESA